MAFNRAFETMQDFGCHPGLDPGSSSHAILLEETSA